MKTPHKSRNREYKIYVSGVPWGATSIELELYFATFGPVLSATEVSKDAIQRKTAERSLGSFDEIMGGSCCIEVADKRTFDAILGVKQHFFKGRPLHCHKFIEGPQVKSLNYNQNKRKVLVKRVLKVIPDEEFKAMLEKNYGPIENMFALMPEPYRAAMEPNRERRYKTYSVTFCTQLSAEMAANASPIYYRSSEPIAIELFNFEKKLQTSMLQRRQPLPIKTDSKCPVPTQPKIDKSKKPKRNSRKLRDNRKALKQTTKEAPLPGGRRSKSCAGVIRMETDSVAPTQRIWVVEKRRNLSLQRGHSRAKHIFSDDAWFMAVQHCRPVSHIYFSIRKYREDVENSFESGPRFLDSTRPSPQGIYNIRINLRPLAKR